MSEHGNVNNNASGVKQPGIYYNVLNFGTSSDGNHTERQR